MDFIACDLETADSANSAPCSIGFATVIDGVIVDMTEYLINPEATFNPMAMRIHKIKPEMVADSPKLPELWAEITQRLEKLPIVFHNAAFDVSVLKKAAKRYGLEMPDVTYGCTMTLSKQYLTLDKVSLKNICNALNIQHDHHHNAMYDAEACAKVMLKLLELGADFEENATHIVSNKRAYSALDEFEKGCLSVIRNILTTSGIDSELVRFSRSKDLNIETRSKNVKISYVKNKWFIAIKHEDFPLISCPLEHDEVKAHHRFYLVSPEDLCYFNDFLVSIVKDAEISWGRYVRAVSEKSVKKSIQEYENYTYNFMTLDI